MTAKDLVAVLVVVAGVGLIAVGIFDLHPGSPPWMWIVLGVVLLASKSVQFYLAFLVRRRREQARGSGRPSDGDSRH